jgi:hypothetical protein
MPDPDLVCLKITNVPTDSRTFDLSQYLKIWASNGVIDDLISSENVRDASVGTYYAKFHYTDDKSELPSLMNKQVFNPFRIYVSIIPASEYPGPRSDNSLPPAPMLFEFEDCPLPSHPNQFRPQQTARRGAPLSKVADDYFRVLGVGGEKMSAEGDSVCKSFR